jgi:hypothetical protein
MATRRQGPMIRRLQTSCINKQEQQ